MFQFFSRVRTYVESELNAALDKAEDPVKMLDQFMRDMALDIREAETAVAKQIANEKILKKKYDDASSMVEKRQQQAVQAVEAGEEAAGEAAQPVPGRLVGRRVRAQQGGAESRRQNQQAEWKVTALWASDISTSPMLLKRGSRSPSSFSAAKASWKSGGSFVSQ